MQMPLFARWGLRDWCRSCRGLRAALPPSLLGAFKDKRPGKKKRQRRGNWRSERGSGPACRRRRRNGSCRPSLRATPPLPRFPHQHREMYINAQPSASSLLEFISPGTVGGSKEQGKQGVCCCGVCLAERERRQQTRKEINRQDNFK